MREGAVILWQEGRCKHGCGALVWGPTPLETTLEKNEAWWEAGDVNEATLPSTKAPLCPDGEVHLAL